MDDRTRARLETALERWAVPVGECLIWTGIALRDRHGQPRYPHINVDRRQCYVRRLVWEREYGVIPKGMVVRNTCSHPLCVAARHLELVPRGNHRPSGLGGAPDIETPTPPPRRCTECGRAFVPDYSLVCYCSEECRTVRAQRIDRERKRRERGAHIVDYSPVTDPDDFEFADPRRARSDIARGVCPLCGQACLSVCKHLAMAHNLARVHVERALEV